MSKLAAVLFDMDGTTVETEFLWQEAETRTMANFGADWTAQDKARAVGGPLGVVAQYMADLSGASAAEIQRFLLNDIEELMSVSAMSVQPGIVELHDELLAAGIPIALVSNSWRKLIDSVLLTTGLHFDVSVGSDEVQAPKPAPDPYLIACDLLGVDPAYSIVLEDSTNGVQSALGAGCFVVAVPQVQTIEPAPRTVVMSTLAGLTLDDLRQLIATA